MIGADFLCGGLAASGQIVEYRQRALTLGLSGVADQQGRPGGAKQARQAALIELGEPDEGGVPVDLRLIRRIGGRADEAERGVADGEGCASQTAAGACGPGIGGE
ncbi:hypothetical protein AA0475_0267 [Acetobacter peroxydans]|nr:hypothetical protein AA0475_0267 [Acetobacter peroxydans]